MLGLSSHQDVSGYFLGQITQLLYLQGKTPVTRNPDIMSGMVMATHLASLKRLEKNNYTWSIILPGFLTRNKWQTSRQRALKRPLSKGCVKCVVLGG